MRVLRLRAEREIVEYFRPDLGPAGSFEIPTREAINVADEIQIEFSFGAMADEVPIHGAVASVTARGADQAPLAMIRVDESELLRVRYLLDVIEGRRDASARKHRRYATSLPVRWYQGADGRVSRLEDISRGGAFLRTDVAPPVGSMIDVELYPEGQTTPLRLRSTVAWVCATPQRAGFGVSFRYQSRGEASLVDDFVRQHSQASPGSA